MLVSGFYLHGRHLCGDKMAGSACSPPHWPVHAPERAGASKPLPPERPSGGLCDFLPSQTVSDPQRPGIITRDVGSGPA